MTANPRFWYIIGAAVAFLALLFGWLFVVNPGFEKAAATRAQVTELEQQASQIQAQIVRLKQQEADLPAQQEALARIQEKIPGSVNVPSLLRSVERIAQVSDVTITEIIPGQITAFSADTAGTGAAPAPGASGAATPAPAPAPTATGSGGQGEVSAESGLSYVPVTLTVRGQYANLQEFATRLERLPRAILITNTSLARAEDSTSSLIMSMDGRVFVVGDKLEALADMTDQGVAQ